MATQTKDKDYYGVLGVKKTASVDEIRKAFRKLSSVLTFSCLALGSAFCQDSDLAGKVYDAQGNPLAGVSVTAMHHLPSGGAEKQKLLTDDQGHFELKDVGRVIFFVAPKFAMLTRIRGPKEPYLEVPLVPDVETRPPVNCPTIREPGERYGSGLLFLVPRGTKVKHHYGDDTWDIDFYFPRSKTKEHANLWSGMLFEDLVEERMILEAGTFRQHGFDWKGKLQDGKNWRWVSFSENLIRYEDASDEAARFFDRVIDSVCVRPLTSEGTTK